MLTFNAILLIDDDDISNYINKTLIESLKITDTVLCAKNGHDAFELLDVYAERNNALPELIFIDLKMPVMDGFEFIKCYTETTAYNKFPTTLVALTNSTHYKDTNELKMLGVKCCLTKPLSKQKIHDFLVQNSLPNVLKKAVSNTFAAPIIPDNELERLKEVRKYNIFNPKPELDFDSIVEEAARTFHAPVSLISIVEEENVLFKAGWGAPSGQFVDRGISLCAYAIAQEEVTVFPDTVEDPCLLANPIVHGAYGVRFYAGAPIRNDRGYQLGTLCIIDNKPRTFSEDDKLKLKELASLVMKRIEERLVALAKK